MGIVGCNNPRTKIDDYVNALTRELIKRNVLVLKTGCAAIASAKAGMLTPEAALELAGPGFREVCEAVGIPPVLHMGSCVDNSRILEAATEVVLEGGLGDDLSDLPAVGVAPEWMSEKAIAIGCYFVASGVDVILGHPFHIGGSENVTRFLNQETRRAVRRVVPRLPETPMRPRTRSWRSSIASAKSWASTGRPNASSTI